MDKTYHYPGDELLLFQHATNWKTYLKRNIENYLQGDVLEVGAGIGGTAKLLNNGQYTSWTMLEPDDEMFAHLTKQQAQYPLNTRVSKGTVESIKEQQYDTIIYIDVLEHIENDQGELEKAASLLRHRGNLIVLSPAFQFLYSPFDKAIGHYKRYQKRDLVRLTPESMKLKKLRYLDSFGFIASAANKLLLKQSYPTQKQVQFWDKTLVGISKIADPILFHSFGKSILAIWEKASK